MLPDTSGAGPLSSSHTTYPLPAPSVSSDVAVSLLSAAADPADVRPAGGRGLPSPPLLADLNRRRATHPADEQTARASPFYPPPPAPAHGPGSTFILPPPTMDDESASDRVFFDGKRIKFRSYSAAGLSSPSPAPSVSPRASPTSARMAAGFAHVVEAAAPSRFSPSFPLLSNGNGYNHGLGVSSSELQSSLSEPGPGPASLKRKLAALAQAKQGRDKTARRGSSTSLTLAGGETMLGAGGDGEGGVGTGTEEGDEDDEGVERALSELERWKSHSVEWSDHLRPLLEPPLAGSRRASAVDGADDGAHATATPPPRPTIPSVPQLFGLPAYHDISHAGFPGVSPGSIAMTSSSSGIGPVAVAATAGLTPLDPLHQAVEMPGSSSAHGGRSSHTVTVTAHADSLRQAAAASSLVALSDPWQTRVMSPAAISSSSAAPAVASSASSGPPYSVLPPPSRSYSPLHHSAHHPHSGPPSPSSTPSALPQLANGSASESNPTIHLPPLRAHSGPVSPQKSPLSLPPMRPGLETLVSPGMSTSSPILPPQQASVASTTTLPPSYQAGGHPNPSKHSPPPPHSKSLPSIPMAAQAARRETIHTFPHSATSSGIISPSSKHFSSSANDLLLSLRRHSNPALLAHSAPAPRDAHMLLKSYSSLLKESIQSWQGLEELVKDAGEVRRDWDESGMANVEVDE